MNTLYLSFTNTASPGLLYSCYYEGPTIMIGYLNNPEADKATFDKVSTGCSGKLCFFTIDCNPSLAYITDLTLRSVNFMSVT